MNPHDRLQNALTAAKEGRYEEALREYVWFHNHALELEPALYGVRLSFALAYWVELAQDYPAARTRLEEIRDRKIQTLLSGQGNRETFHDVSSINYYLADESLTARVFAQLDGDCASLAKQCSDTALPALVNAKRFELARRYVTDPFNRMEESSTRLNQDVDDLGSEPPSEAPILDAYIHIMRSTSNLWPQCFEEMATSRKRKNWKRRLSIVSSHHLFGSCTCALSSAA